MLLITEGCEVRREEPREQGEGPTVGSQPVTKALEQGENAGGRKQEEKGEREAQSL